MTVQEAWSIVGNQPKSAIKNMVKALGMMKALNTPEENRGIHNGYMSRMSHYGQELLRIEVPCV